MEHVDWLNYHHLYYFHAIVRDGGMARAARRLRLSHSTLSTQLKSLEEQLGQPLFTRQGRRLALTPFGREAARYADTIFRTGQELVDAARTDASHGKSVLRVGVSPSLPKSLSLRLLEPGIRAMEELRIELRQDTADRLVDSLASGRLEMLLLDQVPTRSPRFDFHAHALGESDVLWYAARPLARRLRRGYPASLDGADAVLPTEGTSLRASLETWLLERRIALRVRAEADDAGLLRALGLSGMGIFPVRDALRSELADLAEVELVGRCEGVAERYYAISTERRLRHPAAAAVVAAPAPVPTTVGGLVNYGGQQITPDYQALLDEIRNFRTDPTQNTYDRTLNPMDVSFNNLDPISQEVFYRGRQAEFGIPVLAQQWEQNRFRLPGLSRAQVGIGY